MILLKKYYFNVTETLDCISITHEVNYAIRDAKVESGLVTVCVSNARAGILIADNNNDIRGALQDEISKWGEGLSEKQVKNARRDSFSLQTALQSALIGQSLSIPIHQSKLVTDSYTDIYLIDCDQVITRREVLIQVMGDDSSSQQQPQQQMGEYDEGGM